LCRERQKPWELRLIIGKDSKYNHGDDKEGGSRNKSSCNSPIRKGKGEKIQGFREKKVRGYPLPLTSSLGIEKRKKGREHAKPQRTLVTSLSQEE